MSFMRYVTPKTGLCAYEKFYPTITDDGVNDLACLIDIVVHSHFSYVTSPTLLEDMQGGALVKMLEFLKSDRFDPNLGSLKNMLYTICRNECKNVVYRSQKDTPVEDEIMAINEAPALQVSTTKIEITDKQLSRLSRCSESMVSKVKSSLNYIGFITDSDERVWYPESARWVAFVIWMKLS